MVYGVWMGVDIFVKALKSFHVYIPITFEKL
jgi:hypothetical protein